MKNINYRSDFSLEVSLNGKNLDGIPFEMQFYTTSGGSQVEVSYDGTTYTNCKKLDDKTILVVFDNHELLPGVLKVRKEFHIENPVYPDGVQTVVDIEQLDIRLVAGKSDTVNPVKAAILQSFLKPVKGTDYFTPSERNEFKQAVIAALKEDNQLFSEVFNAMKADQDYKEDLTEKIYADMINNESYIANIRNIVYDQVMLNLASNTTFIQKVAQKVKDYMNV